MAEISGTSRGTAAQGPIGQPLHRPAVRAGDQNADGQRHQKNRSDAVDAEQAQAGDDHQADIGADHVNLAVGEIDHADDAVHHRIADGDQGVDAAQRQTVDDLLKKFEKREPGHGRRE
jgi:hypothetical protein